MQSPIEFAASVATADIANDDRRPAPHAGRPASYQPAPHPLTDIGLGLVTLAVCWIGVAAAGWAVVQLARAAGLVS